MNNITTEPVPRVALRLNEAAEALGVCPRTLWQWTRDGIVPARKIGGTVLYSVDGLRTWLQTTKKPQ